jgi:hypothetical protein
MGEERNKALLTWLKIHRPDCVAQMEHLLANSDREELKPIIFAMTLSFEAGRMLQAKNPQIPYDEVLVGAPIQPNIQY